MKIVLKIIFPSTVCGEQIYEENVLRIHVEKKKVITEVRLAVAVDNSVCTSVTYKVVSGY